MKILHISTSDFGGAGLCALRICQSLLDLGVDSKMLVARKLSDEPFVSKATESGKNSFVPSKNRIVRKIQKELRQKGYGLTILERYQREVACLQDKALFTFPISKYDLAKHPLVKEADIIHLHWVASFIDYPTFFPNVERPIVWTIHDENIGYGGFHYKKVRDEHYSKCQSIEDEMLTIKQLALSQAKSDIYPVAISEVMESYCNQVPMLEKYPITLIHNGVNVTSFSPIDKEIARKTYGIPQDRLVFAFCAQSLQDPRKGLKELISALEQLKMENVTLICAGDEEAPIGPSTIDIVKVGVINDEKSLSVFYSCADFFVLSSFEESFGQTPLEAMACGVPVIAFPCGVTKELINEANGIRCKEFTVESLVEGIKAAMGGQYDGETIRRDVIERFSYERIGKQYLELYKSILEKVS